MYDLYVVCTVDVDIVLTALSNRIGDVALLLVIAWLLNFGSLNYIYILFGGHEGHEGYLGENASGCASVIGSNDILHTHTHPISKHKYST
jgi:hypothetical protein